MISVPDVPQDHISRVAFGPRKDERLLLGAFWDSTLKLYDCNQADSDSDSDGQVRSLQSFRLAGELLDACWNSNSDRVVYAGGVDQRVTQIDLVTGVKSYVGKDHALAVNSIVYDNTTQSVLSGSWDKTIQQTDVRSAYNYEQNGSSYPSMSGQGSHFIKLPHKVFSMDIKEHMLVVAMANRDIFVYDTRKLQDPLQRRESSLRNQTRTVRCMHDGQGYASTSMDSRVAVEYFDPLPNVQDQKFAFKCHKIGDIVAPIRGLAFHPTQPTLFTGGSDSTVCMWQINQKKKIKQFKGFSQSVQSLDVSPDGQLLAIGCSNDDFKETPTDYDRAVPIPCKIYIQST